VGSVSVDTGYLPWDTGDEFQSLALELYDAAKVRDAEKLINQHFYLALF
jgi:hypothetical protein